MDFFTNLLEDVGSVAGKVLSTVGTVGNAINAVGAIIPDPSTEGKTLEPDSHASHEEGNVVLSTAAASVPNDNSEHSTPSQKLSSVCGSDVDSREIMLEKFYFHSRRSWKTSQGLYAALDPGSFRYPSELFSNTNVVLNKIFQNYSYARFDVTLKIQVNFNQFNAGAICVYFDPNINPNSTDNLASVLNNPHCIINIASSNEGQFTIPYNHTRKAFDLSQVSDQGYPIINFIVWSQLRAVDGASATLDVSTYFHLSNVELSGITAPHTLWSTTPTLMGDIRSLADTDPETLRELIRHFDVHMRPNSVVRTQNFARVTADFCTSDQVGDIYHSLAFMGEHMWDTSDVAGERDSDIPEFMSVPVPISHLSNTGLLSDRQWATTAAPESVLWWAPVFPTLANTGTLVVANKFSVMHSNLGYFTQLFHMWKGSIKYTFQFFPTRFHKGRVAAVFIPGRFTNTPPTYASVQNCTQVQYDLAPEATEFTFEVPYVKGTEYIPVADANFIIAHSQSSTSDVERRRHTTGQIVLYVINRLVASNTVPANIDYKVLMSAGSDYHVSYPGSDFDGANLQTDQGLVAHCSDKSDQFLRDQIRSFSCHMSDKSEGPAAPPQMENTTSFAAMPEPQIPDSKVSVQGSVPHGFVRPHAVLRAYLMRPVHFYSGTLKVGDNVTKDFTPNDGSSDHIVFLTCPYGYVSGSVRLTVNVSDILNAADHDWSPVIRVSWKTNHSQTRNTTTTESALASGVGILNAYQERMKTFIIPYYQYQNSFVNNSPLLTVTFHIMSHNNYPSTYGLDIDSWISFCPDVRLKWMRTLPQVIYPQPSSEDTPSEGGSQSPKSPHVPLSERPGRRSIGDKYRRRWMPRLCGGNSAKVVESITKLETRLTDSELRNSNEVDLSPDATTARDPRNEPPLRERVYPRLPGID